MMSDKQFTLVMLCVSGGPVCSCWRETEREADDSERGSSE